MRGQQRMYQAMYQQNQEILNCMQQATVQNPHFRKQVSEMNTSHTLKSSNMLKTIHPAQSVCVKDKTRQVSLEVIEGVEQQLSPDSCVDGQSSSVLQNSEKVPNSMKSLQVSSIKMAGHISSDELEFFPQPPIRRKSPTSTGPQTETTVIQKILEILRQTQQQALTLETRRRTSQDKLTKDNCTVQAVLSQIEGDFVTVFDQKVVYYKALQQIAQLAGGSCFGFKQGTEQIAEVRNKILNNRKKISQMVFELELAKVHLQEQNQEMSNDIQHYKASHKKSKQLRDSVKQLLGKNQELEEELEQLKARMSNNEESAKDQALNRLSRASSDGHVQTIRNLKLQLEQAQQTIRKLQHSHQSKTLIDLKTEEIKLKNDFKIVETDLPVEGDTSFTKRVFIRKKTKYTNVSEHKQTNNQHHQMHYPKPHLHVQVPHHSYESGQNQQNRKISQDIELDDSIQQKLNKLLKLKNQNIQNQRQLRPNSSQNKKRERQLDSPQVFCTTQRKGTLFPRGLYN